MSIMELDIRALAATGEIIDRIGAEDWNVATPCAGWTPRDIVTHMIDAHRHFVDEVAGDGSASTRRSSETLADDELATSFEETGRNLTTVFADDEAFTKSIRLGSFGPAPAKLALRVHFTDTLVHGWDLSRALGIDYTIDPELADIAYKVVSQIPGEMRGPGAAFAHPVPVDEHACPSDRLVAMAGRDPRWSVPALSQGR